MGFTNNFRGIFKPTVVGVASLASLSIAFALAYVFVDYQNYLTAYRATQALETEALKEKADATLEGIKKLLALTGERIQVASKNLSPSQGPIQRIERILASVHHLPFQRIPELQIVFYNKLSPPQSSISRFGALPLAPASAAAPKAPHNAREPVLAFEGKVLKARLPVFTPQNSLDGILEFQFGLEPFKRVLGTYATLSLDETQNAIILPRLPFPAWARPPDLFWVYAHARQSHYAVFALYTLFALAFMGAFLSFLDRRLHKSYRHQFENLEDALLKAGETERALKAELGMRRQDAEIHHISCQAQKKFQARLTERQQERAGYMASSLKRLQRPFANPGYEGTKSMELFNDCLQEARALSDGLWRPRGREFIDFRGILDNIQLIFAHKIHEAGITVKTSVERPRTPFPGDSLLMETLLVNVIGKPLHRVPKDGAISISLKELPGFLHLEIRDNGYAGIKAAEERIQKSCSFFMDEETVHEACLANGMRCQYAKAHGLNITSIIMAIPEEEAVNDNVVQLFP